LHYACTRCGKTVPSKFLFDERLFNREYFRHRVAESRARKKVEETTLKGMVRSPSGILWLSEELNLARIDGFVQDLDRLCRGEGETDAYYPDDLESEFDMSVYWHRVAGLLLSENILFNPITPLHPDIRKDRAWLFTTLIFMEHEREVCLTQYGDDILVERT